MKTRGCVSLVFDDGYSHIFDNIVPLLQQHKLPATFAISLDNGTLATQTGLPFTPWEKWLTLPPDHFEIAAHTIHHTDLTRLSLTELEIELKEPAEKLKATTVVYPGGASNDSVMATAQKYYLAGRTTRRGFETLPPHTPMHLHAFNFTRANFSPFKANILALWAYLTNSWLIETYHIITDQPTKLKHAVNQADFTHHLKFLTRLPVSVRTIRDVIRHHSHQK